jgi:hypothetical protein
MLLRRFPILNKLPIQSIQSQALAKEAIQVRQILPFTHELTDITDSLA